MDSRKRRRLRSLLSCKNLQLLVERREGATRLQNLDMAAQLRLVMHEYHWISCCIQFPAFALLFSLFFFFAIFAFSLFSFKCMFDVILFCLLRTSENFQRLRRSLTTNKVSMRMIMCREGVDRVTRSCLWSKSRRRQSICLSNPRTSMIGILATHSHFERPWISIPPPFFFLPFGITVSARCTYMTCLSSYASRFPAYTYV